MKQLDFLETFETAEKRWKARHDIIDQSPASDRIKVLLHMLADFPQSIVDEAGNSLVTVGILKMAARLGRARNTVRSWIAAACETPYLEILDATIEHDERTYVIHWRSLFDRETTQPDATSTASRHDTDSTDANSTSDSGSWGSEETPAGGQFDDERGSIPNSEGVNLTSSGGQIDRGQFFDRGQFAPSSEERLKDVLEESLNTTSPDVLNVLAPEGGQFREAGQSRKRQKPMGLKFWKQWDAAVTVSDLGNAQHVQQLYEMITSMCVFKRCDVNRHRVFANAAMNERMWKSGEALKRKGLFLTNTPLERWFFNHLDQLIATRMIHELEHPTGNSVAARVAVSPPKMTKESPSKLYSEDDSPGQKTKALAGDLAEAWGLVKTIDHSTNG